MSLAEPQRLRLSTSRWRLLLLLAVSLCFVGLGVLLVLRGHLLVGWLNAGFFGLGALVAAIGLVPGGSYLELGPAGLECRSLHRKWFVRWTDVDEFFAVRLGARSMVGWRYAPAYTGQPIGRLLSSGLTGVEAGLPDTYGMSAKALAGLLNEWRLRYS